MTTPTSQGPGPVLALLCDREAAARLAVATRHENPRATLPGTAPVCVERVAELHAKLAEHAYQIVVVEARDADDVPTDEAVRSIRARWPRTVVIGYVRPRAGVGTKALELSRAGVHDLIFGGIDDVGHALRAALGNGVQRSGADVLLDEVSTFVPGTLVSLVRYCFEHASTGCDVPTMARALGVSRQALAARTRSANMPSPRELATWCRLLRAAYELAESPSSVDEVAMELNFPSANGLRNLFRRYAGLSIQDVRRDGAGPVLEAFRAAITEQRTTRALAVGSAY